MSNIKKSYGICLQDCELLDRNLNKLEQLREGDLIRILDTKVGDGDSDKCDKIIVKLYNSDENKFENVLFECAKRYVDYVAETLWLYMIGSKENHTRIRIYNDRDLVLRLKCDTEITINSFGNDSNANIKGVIKLIEPIQNMGFGNFVGLKMKTPPQNLDTFKNLHKNHYDGTTSFLLFRIELLLDAIKIAEQQNSCQNGNYNSKTELLPVTALEQNARESLSDEKAESPVRQWTNHMNSFVSPTSSSNTYASPMFQVNQGQVDTSKSDTNPIATTNASSSYLSTRFSSQYPYSVTPPQITLFDHLCVSDSLPKEIDWPGMIKSKQEPEAQLMNYADNLNQNSCEANNISRSSAAISKDINFQIVTDDTKQRLTGTGVTSPLIQRNNYETENSNFAQLVELPDHTTGTIRKSDRPTRIKKKKVHCNQNNKIPNGSDFNKNHFQRRKKIRPCQNCSNSDLGTFVLKCMHCICIKCFHATTTKLDGPVVRCPYRRHQKAECKYQLNSSEKKHLVLLSTTNNQPTVSDGSDDEEIMFECKTERCEGKWFIPKSDTMNLFKCPLCQINNCIHCKAIHDNMSCTEYKNSLKIQVQPKMLQNLTKKLNNFVVSFIPGIGRVANPELIPLGASGPDGNETLMKCNNKKCTAQWFVLKNENNTLFKCPTCDLYNCTKCNVIHQNQTCDDYQAAKRTKYIPNFMLSKNPINNQAVDMKQNAIAAAKPPINHFTKRKWICNHCTYENFSFGYICEICQKLSTEE